MMASRRSLVPERLTHSDSDPSLNGSALNPKAIRASQPFRNDEVRTIERNGDYMISTWNEIMFLAWRGRETTYGITRSRVLMASWAEDKSSVVLVILMPGKAALSQPPSDEARAAMAEVSRNASPALKGIGIIGNVSGFVGSVVRSVMTAHQALTRRAVPFMMFASPEEAVPWISRRLESRELVRSDFVSAVEKAHWK
jgi:hypothetical protein